jgi:hypothetical protein
MLIENGAGVDLRNGLGQTPRVIAVIGKRITAVKTLIKVGIW